MGPNDWLYYSDRAQSRAQAAYDNEEDDDAPAEKNEDDDN